MADLLDCDTEPRNVAGLAYALEPQIGGDTPEEAVAAWMANQRFGLPRSGYEPIDSQPGVTAIRYAVDGRTKVVVTFSSLNADLLEAPPAIVPPYTMESLAFCDRGEVFAVGPDLRIWADAAGHTLDDRIGPDHCDLQNARLLTVPTRSGPRTYARDPIGILVMFGVSSGSFEQLTTLPADAVDSGFRSDNLQLWFDPSGNAAYVVTGSGVERWPRFQVQGVCV